MKFQPRQVPPSDNEIRQAAKKAGVEEIYDEHRETLIAMFNRTIVNGNGDLAGFLFAVSSLSNEIQKRRKTNFKPN